MRKKTDRNQVMQCALPETRELLSEVAGLCAGGKNLKAQDNAVARLTGIPAWAVRKIRSGQRGASDFEYRALWQARLELGERHARLHEQNRRIAELLSPRRSEGTGLDGARAVRRSHRRG